MNDLISIIIPIFNEEEIIPLLLQQLPAATEAIDANFEFLFVDDGSTDTSLVQLIGFTQRDTRARVIGLSRNFGHQYAITAGLDHARGDAAIIMDADLQDPPQLLQHMIAKWREGFDVVYGVREDRGSESVFKRLSAWIFYRVLNRAADIAIPPDVGDFRLIDKKVLSVIRSMRENDRFLRGLVSWAGFRQMGIPYTRPIRAAGKTKFPFARMLRFAVNGILSFSDFPLRLAVWIGVLISLGSFFYGIVTLALWFADVHMVEGWTSTVIILAFLGGVNLIMTGVVGLYVGRIHIEVKQRPLYVIGSQYGDQLHKMSAPKTEGQP